MISLHISGHNFENDAKLDDYIEQKIGGLDKYLPRAAKGSAGTVILTLDPSGREDNQYVCEVTLQVAGPNLVAKEAAINMYAAVDIVAAKLKAQAQRYKDKHGKKPSRAKLLIQRIFRSSEATS